MPSFPSPAIIAIISSATVQSSVKFSCLTTRNFATISPLSSSSSNPLNPVLSTMVAQHTALVIPAKGAKIQVQQVDTPKPANGEVLVKVAAIGINPVDQKIADWGIVVEQFPYIPGSDLSGVVQEVGEGVTNLKKGDHIAANPLFLLGNKVQPAQEYAIVPADLVAVLDKSSNISLIQASTLPCTFITAAVALTVQLGLTVPFVGAPKVSGDASKQPILVWGAGSNVGINAVFLLLRAGYQNVYAVAGARKHEQIKKLGATRIFDYNEPSVTQDIRKQLQNDGFQHFEKVLDTVTLPNSLEPLLPLVKAPGGKVAVVVPVPDSVKVPEGVEIEMTWAGIPYNLDGKHPEARKLGQAIFGLISNLVETNQFPVNPSIQEMQGPDLFSRYNKALDAYRVHGPKGGKVVVPL